MYPNNYNNRYNGNRQPYGGGGYGQQRPQYGQPQYGQPQQPRYKKSGAKYSIIKNGNFNSYPIVNAWMSTRQGLVKITVAPYKGTHETKSNNGNTFMNMIASIQVGFNPPQLVPCLYNMTNKKIVLSNVGLLITPNGGGQTRSGKRVTGSVVRLQK